MGDKIRVPDQIIFVKNQMKFALLHIYFISEEFKKNS